MKIRWCEILVATACVWAFGQSSPTRETVAQARQKMDSLKMAYAHSAFSPDEQKDWRDCLRAKREFLARSRKSNPDFARVDSLLRDAELGSAGPDDPQVEKLMERKYGLEQQLEDAWRAQTDGKRCLDVEDRRGRKLQAALEANADYRRWQQVTESQRGSTPE